MQDSLHEAFLADHRALTRGLNDLRAALSQADTARACLVAGELDLRAGPHMEFEETLLYPALVRPLGAPAVRSLYREHAVGRAAIRQLQRLAEASADDEPHLDEPTRRALLEQVDTILEHVLGCGSLISHLDRLGAAEQRVMLGELRRLNRAGKRWTDIALPRGRPGGGAPAP